MMKNTVKYLIAAAALTAAFPVFAQNLPAGVYEEKNGIAYKKTATLKPGTTDTYTIDLEAFVTGSVTVKNTSVPADIVLVLDVSGSMNSHIYTAPYTAISSRNYSYNSIAEGDTVFYQYTDGNYYQVNSEYEAYYSWGQLAGYYLRLYFTLNDGTKYYLTKSGRNNVSTITTSAPTNVTYTRYNNQSTTTIWTGVLYSGTDLGSKIDNLKTAVGKFIDEIQHNDLYDEDNNRRKDKDGNEVAMGNQISIVKFAAATYYQSKTEASITEGNHFAHISGNNQDETEYYFENYSETREGTSWDYVNCTEVLKSFTPTESDADVSKLKSAVDGLQAGGQTAAGYGMNLARLLLDSIKDTRTNSSKTVVFFTDGEPTNWGDGFSGDGTAVASTTIGYSRAIKSDYGATVFSVGVFSDLGEYEQTVDNYMNYTSSNYPNALNMSQPGNPASTDPKNLIYYQNASSADLSKVFQMISSVSGGSGATDVSAESVVTVDVVASSFSLPENVKAEDIKVTVAPCNGVAEEFDWDGKESGKTYTYLTFGEAKSATDYGLPAVTPTVDAASRTVSTEGFNFSENWCGYNEETKQYQGYKQIISFEIKMNPDAVGGPNVATNDRKSGIYVNGVQVAQFNRPTVKLPISIWIKKQGLLGNDAAVFNIRYAPYQKDVDPTKIPKSEWKSFTKVMISSKSPKDTDGLPMEKLVGLDPDFFYRIDEDAWAWSYSYQDNGTQYTFGEDLVNPFLFTNKPKETPHEGEATVRNEFATKSSTPQE